MKNVLCLCPGLLAKSGKCIFFTFAAKKSHEPVRLGSSVLSGLTATCVITSSSLCWGIRPLLFHTGKYSTLLWKGWGLREEFFHCQCQTREECPKYSFDIEHQHHVMVLFKINRRMRRKTTVNSATWGWALQYTCLKNVFHLSLRVLGKETQTLFHSVSFLASNPCKFGAIQFWLS